MEETLSPLIKSNPCNDLWIHGPVGTGKTTCIRHTLKQLKIQRNIETVYINCKIQSTQPAVFSRILQLFDFYTARRGRGADEHLDRIRQLLKDDNVVVVLDEFDALENPGELLYRLKTVCEDQDHFLTTVVLSTKSPDGLELGKRDGSRFDPVNLEFPVYTEKELQTVVEDRIESAFRTGVVAETVPELVTDRVANQIRDGQGDVRRALSILRCAGVKAERQGAGKVTAAHVEASFNPARD